MSNIYVYDGISEFAPDARKWKPGSYIRITDIPTPGVVTEWINEGLSWRQVHGAGGDIDPAAGPFFADNTGVVDAQPAFLAALTLAANNSLPGHNTKGHDVLKPAPGRYSMKPWGNVPTGLSIVNEGEHNRVVFVQNHLGISADTAMFTYNVADTNSESQLPSSGMIRGINIDGNKSDADGSHHVGGPWNVDGIRFRNTGSGQRAPYMERVIVSACAGWGITTEDNFSQFRMDHVKCVNNKNGILLQNATDSKLQRNGFGANDGIQMQIVSNTTAMFDEVDSWVPGATWNAQYGVIVDGGYGNRWVNSDFNTNFNLIGNNNNNSNSNDTRKRMLQMTFTTCTFKATTDMALGYSTNHNGDSNYQQIDGTYAPQALFTLSDGGGLAVVGASSFGFGTITMINSGADIPTDVEAARPDYIARFVSSNNTSKLGLMADRRGTMTLGAEVELCHFQSCVENQGATDSPSQAYSLRKPWPVFKRRITNDDRFLKSVDLLKPVIINKNIDLFAGKNYGPRFVALKGQTGLPVDYHPLAYLALSLSVHLKDGVTTFSLPNISDLSSDYCYALRYW